VEFGFRYTLKTGARTQYVVIDAEKWRILKPLRRERSRTGAHGKDIYCLTPEEWNKTITVLLTRSNSGKLYYDVVVPRAEYEKYRNELLALLDLAGDIEEMIWVIRKCVSMRKAVSR
jgi:purine nucleoside permease